MKKIISVVLSIVLMLTLFPNDIYADDSDFVEKAYTSKEIIDLACAIWPEHEDTLENQSARVLTRSQNIENDKVILQENHKLSENVTISYIEKESGFAFVTVVENWVQSTQTSGNGYTEYAGNLYATCGSCSSNLLGFKYRIYNSSYDKIMDYGYFTNTSVNVTKHGSRTVETASDPAYYTYGVNFVNDFGWVLGSTIINFRIQNNEFYCAAE